MGRVELNGGQGTSCSTVPVWARATASGSGPSIFNYVSHCSVHRDHGVQPAHHKCSHAAELGWQWLLSFASGDRRAPRPGTDRPQWQQRPWFELEVSGIKMQFITGEVERDAHTHLRAAHLPRGKPDKLGRGPAATKCVARDRSLWPPPRANPAVQAPNDLEHAQRCHQDYSQNYNPYTTCAAVTPFRPSEGKKAKYSPSTVCRRPPYISTQAKGNRQKIHLRRSCHRGPT